jgi:hypothetical protein
MKPLPNGLGGKPFSERELTVAKKVTEQADPSEITGSDIHARERYDPKISKIKT